MAVNDTWAEWKTDDSNLPPGTATPEIDDELRNIKKQTKINCVDLSSDQIITGQKTLQDIVIEGAAFKDAIVDAHAYGTKGTQAAIEAAITAIGSDLRTLRLVPATWSITADLTIPSNITLWIERGAVLDIADTKTLTINGGLRGGRYKYFTWTGTGKVAFGEGSLIYAAPEWWGAIADGSTNCAPAFQAAFDAWPCLSGARGTYVINNTTIYLNNDGAHSGYHGYVFKGLGIETRVKFTNFTSGYCVKRNENADGDKVWSFPTYPSVLFEDVFFETDAGDGVPAVDFIKMRERGGIFRNVRFEGFIDCVEAEDYCDGFVFENINVKNCKPSGFLMNFASDAGDNLRMENVNVHQSSDFQTANNCKIHSYGILKTSECKGAVIDCCIGGRFEIRNSNGITINGCHVENCSCSDLANSSWMVLNGSEVTINRCFLENNWDYHVVYINDNTATSKVITRLTLNENYFVTAWYSGDGSPFDKATSDLYIKNLQQDGSITLKNNISVFKALAQRQGENGLKITAEDSNLNDALAALPNLWCGELEIIAKNGDGSYAVGPPHAIREAFYCTNPEKKSHQFIAKADVGPSDLAVDEYFYYLNTITDTGKGKTGEFSVNVTEADKVIKFIFDLKIPYVLVRLFRGTTTGTYTHYVDIPVKHSKLILYDCGSHISGLAWQPVGDLTPYQYLTHKNAIVHSCGKRIFFGNSIPTHGEHVAGDQIIFTSPSAGNPPGAVCVTSGDPGTWVNMANLST